MPRRAETSTKSTLSHARAVFLASLAKTCQIARSARAAKVDRSTVYLWRKSDPEFAKAWDLALEQAADMLEDVAVQRATRSANPSDSLLTLLLKAHKPEKYRERTDVQLTADLHIAEGLQQARERARRAGA
jgi:hypothetical protein